ncbi:hypothetical protein [Streptomyces sp. NPDC058247]|uniref:hypothetical protein n=1 Tax=Streptomyces sp. NPDC058247 TaxID=3346401 RepID=UPI0036E0E810
MTNIVSKWFARRRVGRVAVAALLANELENGDLQERIAACLADRGADPVLREAVARQLAGFRRTTDRGMKLAQLTELAASEEHGMTTFFVNIEAADRCAERLLPVSRNVA